MLKTIVRHGRAVTTVRRERAVRDDQRWVFALSVADIHTEEIDAMAVFDFRDLPLTDRDREWDGDAANKRLRKWAHAEKEPNDKYRRAFVWYEPKDEDNFKGYKFQIADVVDGKLKAVPHAIFNAAAVMQGARGGAKLPQADIAGVKRHLARYYDKIGETPPWDDKE